MLYKRSILNHFAKFTGKHLRRSLILIKLQVLLRSTTLFNKRHKYRSELRKIFRNTIFTEQRATASRWEKCSLISHYQYIMLKNYDVICFLFLVCIYLNCNGIVLLFNFLIMRDQTMCLKHFFLYGFSITNIDDSQDSRGRGR